ncbi:MAG: AMP-binding protein [Promethearchaeota archaeon]
MVYTQSKHKNTLYKLVSKYKEQIPQSQCIISPGQPSLSYIDLYNHIHYVAETLNSLEIGINNRVATVIPNGPEMATAFLSVASCSTCAPLRPTYSEKDFEFYLKDINAKALITLQDFKTPARNVARNLDIKIIELKPLLNEPAGTFQLISDKKRMDEVKATFSEENDTALVLHTSGTTARPKIVPLTQQNLCSSANNIMGTLNLLQNDRCLNIMPLFHIHGLIGAVLSSVSAGASIICTRGFNVNTFFDIVHEHKPTWYTAVPTMHHSILSKAQKDGVKDTNLRFIRSSSQALPPKIMKELEDIFEVPVIESYGMTEASHQMASNPLPPGIRKPGSVGKAAGPEISIMNEEGEHLHSGETGEIVIRGSSVTKAYENNEIANTNSFTQGWFRTGDEGYLDEDNYLYITSRIKEIINRGGEKISPREIDEALLDLSEINEALAFSVPHERLGETVGVAIVLEKGCNLTKWEIQQYIAKNLGDYKVPEEIIFLEEIPKGATGKVQRIGLAEKLGVKEKRNFVDSVEEKPIKPPTNQIEKKLHEIWSEVLRISDLGVNQNYFQLGGDSILAASIIAQMREKMGIKNVSPVIFLHAPTIEQMAEYVRKGEISSTTEASVVRLKDGSGMPIFFVHSESRGLEKIQLFIKYLRAPNPIYGLRPMTAQGDQITIEDIASKYLIEITSLFPEEKIALAGIGIGSLIASELAHQMTDRSSESVILLLISPYQPVEYIKEKKIGNLVRSIIDKKFRTAYEATQRLLQEASSYKIQPYNGSVFSIIPEPIGKEINWITHHEIKISSKSYEPIDGNLDVIGNKSLANRLDEIFYKYSGEML